MTSRTARIALSGVVADLQELRRQVSDWDVHDCAEVVHHYMVEYMDKVIEAYLSFMGRNERTANEQFQEAGELLNSSGEARKAGALVGVQRRSY